MIFDKQDAMRYGETQYFTFTINNVSIDARLSAIRDYHGIFSVFLFMGNDSTEKVQADKNQQAMVERLQKS